MDTLKLKDLLLELVEELRIARITISENESRLKELVEECHDKERTLEKEISRHQSLRDEQAESVDSVRRTLHDRIKFMESEKNKLQLASESWEREIKTLKDDVRKLQLSKYNLEKTIREQAHRLQTQGQTKNAHTEQMADMEAKCKDIQRQMTSYGDMLDALKREVGEASCLNKSLEFSTRHQECEISSLHAKLDERQEEIVKLRVQLANQPEDMVAEQREMALQLELLQGEVQQTLNSNKALETQCEDARKSQQTTQRQLQEAQELGQRLLLTSKETTAKVSEKDNEITALLEKNRALQEDHAKMSKDTRERAKKLDEMKRAKDEEAKDFQNEIQKLKEELDAAQKAGSILEEINSNWASKNQALTNDIRKLQTEMEKKDSDAAKLAIERAEMLLDNSTQTGCVEYADAYCITDDLINDSIMETKEHRQAILNNPDADDNEKTVEKHTGLICDSEKINHSVDDANVIEETQPVAFHTKTSEVADNLLMVVADSPQNEGDAPSGIVEQGNIEETVFESTNKEIKLLKSVAETSSNLNQTNLALEPKEGRKPEETSSQHLNVGDDERVDGQGISTADHDKYSTSDVATTVGKFDPGDIDLTRTPKEEETTILGQSVEVNVPKQDTASQESTTRAHSRKPMVENKQKDYDIYDGKKVVNYAQNRSKDNPDTGGLNGVARDFSLSQGECITQATSMVGPSSDGLYEAVLPVSSKHPLPTANPESVSSTEKTMKKDNSCRGSTEPEAMSSIHSSGQGELHDDNARLCIDDIIPSTFNQQECKSTLVGGEKTKDYRAPDLRISVSYKGDADENKPLMKFGDQSKMDGENLREFELPRKSIKTIDIVPTPEMHSLSRGKINTPTGRACSKAVCFGPPRRIPSLDLPHLSALQSPREMPVLEKSTQLSNVSTTSFSRHTDRGKVETSLTPTAMMPTSLRKRNLPIEIKTSPFSSRKLEDQQPPTKISTSVSMLNPLQTAQMLHRSLQDLAQVSGEKSSFKRGQLDAQLCSSQRSVHSATSVQPTKEMFGLKSSSEPFEIRHNSKVDPGQVTEGEGGTIPSSSSGNAASTPMTIMTVGSVPDRGGAGDGEVSLFSDDEDGDMKEGVASQIERIQTFLRKDRLTRSKKDGM